MRKSLGLLMVVAAIGLVGCGKSSSPTGPSSGSSGTTVTVFIRGGSFTPSPLTVKAGWSVNWKNEDTMNHNAVSLDGKFDTGVIPGLSAHSVSAVMTTAGTFAYRCTLHPNESGTIVVQP